MHRIVREKIVYIWRFDQLCKLQPKLLKQQNQLQKLKINNQRWVFSVVNNFKKWADGSYIFNRHDKNPAITKYNKNIQNRLAQAADDLSAATENAIKLQQKREAMDSLIDAVKQAAASATQLAAPVKAHVTKNS